ncbi:MAG: DUF2461 domain-containing protein [Cytophagales bacterium]|nr:DUF2461 domain-containing protein [Cytophagales bacterium]
MEKVFDFLLKLRENNNREWFEQNRDEYEVALEEMIGLAEATLQKMRSHDEIEPPSAKKVLKRIYRDTRFSKVKTPYKNHWSGSFKRASAHKRGGYYFHLEPGNSFVAGGFWGPEKEDLKRIREHLSQDATQYLEVIQNKNFKNNFGEVIGEQLKKAPKDFDPEDPNIELLRYKQFILKKTLSDKEVFSKKLPDILSNSFQEMRPYFDVMSEYLTTDLNGLDILE